LLECGQSEKVRQPSGINLFDISAYSKTAAREQPTIFGRSNQRTSINGPYSAEHNVARAKTVFSETSSIFLRHSRQVPVNDAVVAKMFNRDDGCSFINVVFLMQLASKRACLNTSRNTQIA